MRKNIAREILLLTFLASIIFAVLEYCDPFFFLQDDNQNSYLYVYKYSFDALTHGDIAFYNFHQFLGLSFFSTGQTGTLNPLVIISCLISKLIFNDYYGVIDIMAYIHLVIAAIGMHLILRKQSVRTPIAIIGALAWAFNTFNIFMGRSWFIVILTTAWIPFVFLGTLYLYEHLSLKGIIVSSIPKLILFYCGHPQFFIWGIIFDFLSMVIFIIWVNRKEKKNKKFFLYYLISFIPLTLLALPLLGPMWVTMNASTSRGDAMDVGLFMQHLIHFDNLIPGLIRPFAEANDRVDIYITVKNRICYFTLILMIVYVIGVIAMFFIRNKKIKEKLIALYVLSLAVCIAAGSEIFTALIYLVPILNRFRWPFKYMLWFPFFAVIASCILLNVAAEKYLTKKNIIERIISIALILVTSINIVIICVFSTGNMWGLRMQDSLTNVPADLNDTFSNNRYMSIGTKSYHVINDNYDAVGNSIYKMNYNAATYFGYSNVLGYDALTPGGITNRFGDLYYDDYMGAATPESADFIDECYYLGVSLFIIDKTWAEENPQILEDMNLELVETKDDWMIYSGRMTEPIVRTTDGLAIDYEEKTNSIVIRTDASFEGGEILLMYSYNPYFEVYVNGKKSDIKVEENSFYTMKLDAPSGANEITVKYHDTVFEMCCVLSILGLAVFSGTWILIDKKLNRKIQ